MALEVNAGGEPGRVIVDGVGHVPGATMFEKMCHLRDHADGLRRRMLREPRGYPGLCCNVLLPPAHPDADAGFVTMEQSEYPAISGSNAICVTTALVETGRVPVSERVTGLTLEASAGPIRVEARVENGRCVAVSFDNVPAFRPPGRRRAGAGAWRGDGGRGVGRHVVRHRRRGRAGGFVSRRLHRGGHLRRGG